MDNNSLPSINLTLSSFFSNNHISKSSKLYGFVLISIAILLSAPFLQSFLISTFLVIFASEEISISNYFALLSESFIYRYYFNIPSIVALILGLYLLRLKQIKNHE